MLTPDKSRVLSDPTLFTDILDASVDDAIAVKREYRRVLKEWPDVHEFCRKPMQEIEAGIESITEHVHSLCWFLEARAQLQDTCGAPGSYSAVLRQSVRNARHALESL